MSAELGIAFGLGAGAGVALTLGWFLWRLSAGKHALRAATDGWKAETAARKAVSADLDRLKEAHYVQAQELGAADRRGRALVAAAQARGVDLAGDLLDGVLRDAGGGAGDASMPVPAPAPRPAGGKA